MKPISALALADLTSKAKKLLQSENGSSQNVSTKLLNEPVVSHIGLIETQ